MANSDTPFGFRPIGSLYGGPYSGQLFKVAFEDEDSTATFIGDFVKLAGSADTEGNPTVAQCADEDTEFFGCIVSFEPDRTDLELKYRVASTARTAYIAPCVAGALFVGQVDASVAVTDIGNTADIVVGSGNTTTGVSAMEVLSSSFGSATNLHVIALYQSPDNEFGTNAKLIVRVNENSISGVGAGQ